MRKVVRWTDIHLSAVAAAAVAAEAIEWGDTPRGCLLDAAVGLFHRRLHGNQSVPLVARRKRLHPPMATQRHRAGAGHPRRAGRQRVCRVTGGGGRLTSSRRHQHHHHPPSARQFDQRDAASAPPTSDQLYDDDACTQHSHITANSLACT